MSARQRRNSITARCLAIVGASALAMAGCGGAPSAPPAPGVASAATAVQPAGVGTAPVIMPKEPDSGPVLPPITYEVRGRRDPFVPVAGAVQQDKTGLAVATMKLGGVVHGRTLLALVEAPDGIGYILKPGDVLGNGRVTDITSNSVSFAVISRPGQAATTVTLRLASD
jgi:hypothetical protein